MQVRERRRGAGGHSGSATSRFRGTVSGTVYQLAGAFSARRRGYCFKSLRILDRSSIFPSLMSPVRTR